VASSPNNFFDSIVGSRDHAGSFSHKRYPAHTSWIANIPTTGHVTTLQPVVWKVVVCGTFFDEFGSLDGEQKALGVWDSLSHLVQLNSADSCSLGKFSLSQDFVDIPIHNSDVQWPVKQPKPPRGRDWLIKLVWSRDELWHYGIVALVLTLRIGHLETAVQVFFSCGFVFVMLGLVTGSDKWGFQNTDRNGHWWTDVLRADPPSRRSR